MSLVQKIIKKYTYQDYLNFPDDERCEIIDGEVYDMSPSPTKKHQEISRNLTWIFGAQRDKLKNCSFYEAPMDVVLDEHNVIQPDLFIVCEKNKDSEYVVEPPAMIIEIVSKSTVYKDTKIKKDLYEKFGIQEYILVFPDLEIVQRYILENNKYSAPDIFNWDEKLKLKTFDIEINLWEVFEKEKEVENKSNKPNNYNKPNN